MGFWVDWELWEKMCFVLGCLIVIVVAYGLGVQIYNSRRIKRMAATEREVKSQQGATFVLDDLKNDDIPFGSRAIESGIEVEGIWISSHNSPRRSPLQAGTPQETRPPSLGQGENA
ncbi:predicted protein [Uncinocarpus reesii 1704]|uniref:Uncharacterized protein n=1 Tax=Uncinocarpus reesii (strain UAMH 1704) TaxID=336963 RepID=C4JQT1_UNCRE|nr:uncharacterized protein UREG_03413 [Uncinocarpus reesii 1704]EEP78567.1 predicted protein [Uncinocarpus reesii 1704]